MQLALNGCYGFSPACLVDEYAMDDRDEFPDGFSELVLCSCLCCGADYPAIDSMDRPVDVCNACVDALTEQAALLYSSSGGELIGLCRDEDFADGLLNLAAGRELEQEGW